MQVSKGADGKFSIAVGAQKITLTKSQYEDIYYALPQDNGTLYRLINDTVIQGEPMRQTWKAMLDAGGGMEPALTALQKAVQALAP